MWIHNFIRSCKAKMASVVLIFGLSGQDGSYLAEQFIHNHKDVDVHGVVRRMENNVNIEGLTPFLSTRFHLHLGDITDGVWIHHLISKVKPNVIYNLAGETFVHASFENPINTFRVNTIGVANILEAMRHLANVQQIKLFQALTSQMYGQLPSGTVIDEKTPMKPESPYAVSKLSAHQLIEVYRKGYNLSVSSAISFNHESPRRGDHFVTRKVTKHVARVHLKLTENPLQLGNINSFRDWGHSRDYVKAFIKMMDLKESTEFVISTGTTHSVRELVEYTFKLIGINIKWRGEGLKEEGFCAQTGKVYVKINEKFYRPCEVPYLLGNSQKIQEATTWKPEATFESLIKQMLDNDIKLEGAKSTEIKP